MKAIAARFKEPSTWAGLGALLAALGIGLPEALWGQIAMAGMAVAGLIAMILPEQGHTGGAAPDSSTARRGNAAPSNVAAPDSSTARRP